MHGGEPMLAGPAFIRGFIGTIRESLGDAADVRFGMQSNGTRLDLEMLEIVSTEDVSVGISIDGDLETNDRYRLDHRGNSSYEATTAAIEQLREHDRLAGLLCTIDLEADPLHTYRTLAGFDPKTVDFTFPLGHHDEPPPGKRDSGSETPYADWLIPIFDAWFTDRPQRIRIRQFQDIIGLLIGGRSSVETIGIGPVDIIVVETDGSLEGVDTLKIVTDGAAALDLNIFEHSFADAMNHPMIEMRQSGLEALCRTCQNCPVGSICGGGYFPTRYRHETGFRNPSVYCADYYKIIRHIRTKVIAEASRAGVAHRFTELPALAPAME